VGVAQSKVYGKSQGKIFEDKIQACERITLMFTV